MITIIKKNVATSWLKQMSTLGVYATANKRKIFIEEF